MWSLFFRFVTFILLLFLGFQLEWEWTLAVIIALVVLGNIYWEFLLLGFILDLILGFPRLFFTLSILLIFVAALLGELFFESKTLFNHLAKSFVLSILASLVALLFFFVSFSGQIEIPVEFGASVFVKIFLLSSFLLILYKIRELRRGPQILFE